MSKRDIEIIADIIAQARGERNYIAGLFADSLKYVDPTFDRVKFIKRATEVD